MIIIETLLRIIIYAVLLLAFFTLPVLTGLLSRVLFRRSRRVKAGKVVLLLSAVQILVLCWLWIQPLMTFSKEITEQDIAGYGEWARETLESRFSGIYSANVPVVAYQFHIQKLSDGYVRAEIRYLPLGAVVVEWDGLYEVIRPFSGL